MVCGWCKKSGLKLIRITGVRGEQVTYTGDVVLQEHVIPTTMATVCKGHETYKDLDSVGRPSRAY